MASGTGKVAKATAAVVAATAGATITVTETVATDHPGEMTMIAMAIGEIAVVKADPHGIWKGGCHGAMAPSHRTHVTAIGL